MVWIGDSQILLLIKVQQTLTLERPTQTFIAINTP